MITSTQKNGIPSFRLLVIDILKELTSNSHFDIVKIDNLTNGSIDNIKSRAYIRATKDIDPIADTQPWVMVFEFDEDQQWLDIYTATPDQIIVDDSSWRVAVKALHSTGDCKAGKLTPGSIDTKEGTETGKSHTLSYEDWKIRGCDTQAYPFSFQLCLSDHGVCLAIWAESADDQGDKITWLCVQRMVNDQGQTVTQGKAPLFCVFSNRGNYSRTVGVTNRNMIQKFVVRESDVNAPTLAITAVEDSADSTRIINNKEQVSISEDNEIVLVFPNGLTTQRHGYDHQLDMIGIISSDVLSQSSSLKYNPFNEDTDRVYTSMTASQPYNAGIRLMFWSGQESN